MKKCNKCLQFKELSDYPKANWIAKNSKKDGFRAICKKCQINLQKKYKVRQLKYMNYKNKSDIQFRLRKNLRQRLYMALKRNNKVGSAVKDLGCTIDEFKIYLESKFIEGMNWKNYGQWEIDHIVDLKYFDLTNREELLKACNFNNLQPLWKSDNIKKSRLA